MRMSMCGFCNVWDCVIVGILMGSCVCAGLVTCGFCNVLVCVCVGFVTCGCL